MPKYGVHSIIMEQAAEKSGDKIKTLMETYRGAALLGAIGPDLLFFSPEYKAFDFFMSFAQGLLEVKKAWGTIKEAINNVIEPIEEAIEEYAAPVVEAVDTVEKILPMSCIEGLVEDVMAAASTLKSAISNTLMVAADEGIDLIADAADLPSFSHKVFDEMFTPEHQHGKREWDWYWFDMLHYRNSGLFAKNLLKFADPKNNVQMAYALGYMTHVAADVTGHAFLNRIVCGPYRMHPQRHVIIENFLDTVTYSNVYGTSVNKELYDDLLSSMADPDYGVCSVDEYSQAVNSISTDIRDLLDVAFRATYPTDPTTETDTNPPRPSFLSTGDISKTVENFLTTLMILRDSYVEKPEGLDERYQKVADTLNDILSQFEAPPSPPDIGNTRFCLDWDCVENFFENVADWLAWFGELAVWTFETIANALDLLLELACEALIAVVRAVMYLVEFLSYQLYEHMHFVLSLNGYVCPEATNVLDDPRGKSMIHTGNTTGNLYATSLSSQLSYTATYPRTHDHLGNALKAPATTPETPVTHFPKHTDDYATAYIWDDPWRDNDGNTSVESVLTHYANAQTPADSQNLARPNDTSADTPGPLRLGNAVDFASWMMKNALTIKAMESGDDSAIPDAPSHVVHCNWDLDSDRGYAYKQWCTPDNPSSEHDLEEYYLGELLSRNANALNPVPGEE